jgi:aminopeptidase-like protein
VDLPVALVMRSKYGEYPEYHTSLDDLRFITPTGLLGGFTALKRCIETIESNRTYKVDCLCEPQLGKRGLYANLSSTGSADDSRTMMDLIAYCDGDHDLLAIADRIGAPFARLEPIVEVLQRAKLLSEVPRRGVKP